MAIFWRIDVWALRRPTVSCSTWVGNRSVLTYIRSLARRKWYCRHTLTVWTKWCKVCSPCAGTKGLFWSRPEVGRLALLPGSEPLWPPSRAGGGRTLRGEDIENCMPLAQERHTYPPDDAEEYAVRRVWSMGLAVSLSVLQISLALAVVSRPAQEYADRGYALLVQARLEAESSTRERLLTAATAAFKEAYQSEPTDLTMQVHALLGAAQAELLVQHPRRVFPFLWQATPLQRAEKNLQQALFIQPDNAAAALLLGIVYWRQAAQDAGQQDVLERSKYYLTQAAGLGLPIRLSPTPGAREDSSTGFSVDDTVLALRYV